MAWQLMNIKQESKELVRFNFQMEGVITQMPRSCPYKTQLDVCVLNIMHHVEVPADHQLLQYFLQVKRGCNGRQKG